METGAFAEVVDMIVLFSEGKVVVDLRDEWMVRLFGGSIEVGASRKTV